MSQEAGQRRVVFICTGNYYRSRYAELYFNAHVPPESGWHAESRGFRLSSKNAGSVAACVLDRLCARQIAFEDRLRAPLQLQPAELTGADYVVVLDETEHRPFVEQAIPAGHAQITYWHVPDVALMPADQALDLIEREVDALLERLA